ncbi:MAG: DUF3892 domain-containing protein [Chthoniobacterales bacterium]
MTQFVHVQESGSFEIKEHEVNSVLISRTGQHNTLEHITHIGNNDSLWKISRGSAVRRIEGGNEEFYTFKIFKTQKVYLYVVRPTGRPAYVETQADGILSDNLLSLPACTPECVDKSASNLL